MLRRALIGLILGVSLAGTLGAYAPAAHAQFDGSTSVDNALTEQQTTATEQKAAAVTSVSTTTGNNGNVPANQNAKDAQDASYGWIMQKIMQLFAWMLGVAAITLQDSVYYTVVTMGQWIHGLNAIGTAWRVLRDIGNIVLIFGFLAIGISTILDLDLYGWNNKMLPKLLIAAVFINFSLFASQALIDVGNLFATQFYTQINGGEIPTPVNEQFLTAIHNEGISNKIMSQVGLADIYGQAARNPAVLKSSNTWISGFMGIILFIITSFVMFSLALILIARFVALVFLMVVAPIGFAGLAVPKLEKVANEWWGTLVNEVITAPILLLLLYVALAVISDPLFFGGFDGQHTGPDWLGWIDNGNLAGFAATMMSFLVAMGLLMAVAIVAKKMASFGSSWAMKTAGAASFGVAGLTGRTTVGWAAYRTGKALKGTWVARTPLVGTGIVKGFDKIGSSSFEGRVPLKSVSGVDAGKAQSGGYKKDLENRIKSRTEHAKDLKGRELKDEEKIERLGYQNRIAKEQKDLKRDEAARALAVTEGRAVDPAIDERIRTAKERIKGYEKKIEDIESVTDKGAQRKYAKVLLAGLDKNSTFNKYFNFAANTEAAKKIVDAAKKSSDDKALETIKKAMKKAEEEEAAHAPETPAAGAAGAAPAAPSAAPSAPSGGGGDAHH